MQIQGVIINKWLMGLNAEYVQKIKTVNTKIRKFNLHKLKDNKHNDTPDHLYKVQANCINNGRK